MSKHKRIPAQRAEDVEVLLCRSLNLVGHIVLARRNKDFPFTVAQWETKLMQVLEELNDMQVTPVLDEPGSSSTGAGKRDA